MSCTSKGANRRDTKVSFDQNHYQLFEFTVFPQIQTLGTAGFSKPMDQYLFFFYPFNLQDTHHPEFLFQRFGGRIFAHSPGSWTIRAAGQWCVLLLCRYRLCLVASLDCFSTSDCGITKSEECVLMMCSSRVQLNNYRQLVSLRFQLMREGRPYIGTAYVMKQFGALIHSDVALVQSFLVIVVMVHPRC